MQIVTQSPEAILHKSFWKNKTPLMLAAEQGNLVAIGSILWACEQLPGNDFSSYLNDVDSTGNTALMLACKRNHPNAVTLLLEEGADPLVRNNRGESALHLAVHRSNPECAELILEAPVSNIPIGNGHIGIAATAPITDFAGECRFMDLHTRLGFTALHLASLSGCHRSAAALVRHGATLDIPVLRGLERWTFLCGGSTALHIAAGQGDVRTCAILLEGQSRYPGLELRHIRNMLGLTALNCALLEGYQETARFLVEASRRRRPHSQSGILLSNLSMSSPFPETLRVHMLSILQRAIILLQLRQIAKNWEKAGVGLRSDAIIITALPGLGSLSVHQIRRLQRTLRREGSTLRQVLSGLESALSSSNDDNDNSGRDHPEAVSQRSSVDWTLLGRDMMPRRGPSALRSQLQHRRTAREERMRQGSPRQRQTSNDDDDDDDDPMVIGMALETEGPTNRDDGRSQAGQDEERSGVQHGSARRGANRVPTVPRLERVLAEVAQMTGMEDEEADREREAFLNNRNRSLHGGGNGVDGFAEPGGDDSVEGCTICMDSAVEVAFLECKHTTCFECACKLCMRSQEAPTCPFCRVELEGVEAIEGARKKGA